MVYMVDHCPGLECCHYPDHSVYLLHCVQLQKVSNSCFSQFTAALNGCVVVQLAHTHTHTHTHTQPRLCSNQPSSPRRHHREDRLQLVEKGVREEVDTNLDAPGSGKPSCFRALPLGKIFHHAHCPCPKQFSQSVHFLT